MRNCILFILMLSAIITMTACKNPIGRTYEIDKYIFVKAIGIDKLKDNEDGVRITLAENSETTTQQSMEVSKQPRVLSANGVTIYDAMQNFNKFSDENIFLGHAEFILISEDAAKDDILKYLDFLTRNHELRLNLKVMIVKGYTAEKIIKESSTPEKSTSRILQTLTLQAGELSISRGMDLLSILQTFDNEQMSAYIPYIDLADVNNSNDEKADMQLSGFAVFKDVNLFGFIENGLSKGLNWVRNEVESGTILVKDTSGGNVTLEILDANTKIIPRLENGELKVTVNVKMSSNIAEQQSKEDIYNKSSFDYMESQQNSIIASEVEQAINYSQQNNMDILGICEAIHHKYPVKWEEMKKSWSRIFPGLKIYTQVESKINRVYLFKIPTRNLGEAKI